jgi:phosphohistidine phosphatase SixA
MQTAALAVIGICLGAIAACAGEPADVSEGVPQALERQTGVVEVPPVESPPDPEPPPPVAVDPGADLWSQLQQAETHYFVLMRHALAPGTGDPANFQLNDCSTQRNLSEAGREQARRTGAEFQQRGIVVSQVLSSQWCRCLETAELLGLGPVEPFVPLNSFFRDRSTAAAQTEQVRQFMREHPQTPGVTIMVTHFVNVSALGGAGVASGEMVVMQVTGDDNVDVVGRLEAF